MGAWWEQVWEALRADFSDLPDAGQVTRVVVRLLLAAALGGLLGWQRERVGKAAGRRTHMLVALGAAFVVFVPQQAGFSSADLSRVVQGLVAGVGFLGAGAILKPSNGEESCVHGLTTAAGIWFTAAVGVAVGLGREATAVLGTLLALGILSLASWESDGAAVQRKPPETAPGPNQGGQAPGDAPPSAPATSPAPPRKKHRRGGK
jgi:putative Mg2+ transporter-C (MgtC) family protein